MDFIGIMFVPFAYSGIFAGGTLFFFLLGWLWFSPITSIGKIWGKYYPASKKTPPPINMAIMMVFQLFMGFIVTHTTMALWLFSVTNDLSELYATLFIVKMYLGFVFIKDLGQWFFEKRPFSLVLIGVGYYLVGILGVCALLSYFR